jgi:hypothetical protein
MACFPYPVVRHICMSHSEKWQLRKQEALFVGPTASR